MFSTIIAFITGAGKSVVLLVAGITTVAVVSVVIVTRPPQTSNPAPTDDDSATQAATQAATQSATLAPTSTLLPGTGTPVTTPEVTPSAVPYVSIVIDGPVTSIDTTTNIIVVYNYKVKLRDDDPIRLKLKIGHWVHITGNFEKLDGDHIVIIAIVIIIIDNPTIIIVPGNGGMGGMGDDD